VHHMSANLVLPLACWSCKFLHCYVYTIDVTHMYFCMSKMAFAIGDSLMFISGRSRHGLASDLPPIRCSRKPGLSMFFALSMITCARCCCTSVHHSPSGPTYLPLRLTCSIISRVTPAMISPHISCSSAFHRITRIYVFLVAAATPTPLPLPRTNLRHAHCLYLPWLPH
jgi:hypothetical protein